MKKSLLILFIFFCVLFCSKKVQAQNCQPRATFYVNFYPNVNPYFTPLLRPVVYVINDYTIYLNTVYYTDWSGCRIGHGYNIYRRYIHYSDGRVIFMDTYTYF